MLSHLSWPSGDVAYSLLLAKPPNNYFEPDLRLLFKPTTHFSHSTKHIKFLGRTASVKLSCVKIASNKVQKWKME